MKRFFLIILGIAVVLSGMYGFNTARAEDRSMEVSVIDGKIIVTSSGDFGIKDWIGIYKPGEGPGTETASLVWWYTGGNGGTVTLPDDVSRIYNNRLDEFISDGKIIPGEYKIFALADDGYELIEEISPVEITVGPAEADIAIDYDASSFIGSEFRQIYWNGEKFNNYEGGEKPAVALAGILNADGKVDDAGGTGVKLGLAGWVGFEQDIVAFGSIVNDAVIWSDAFDKGTDNDIKSEDKGGRFARKYEVEIDLSKLTGEYTAGVIVALSDGTLVKLNSTASPAENTFISFIGPDKDNTADLNIETGDDVDKVPGAVLMFDREDNYSPFFDGLNEISGIEYSDGLKCFVVTMDNASDPFFTFSFPNLIFSDEMPDISADDYKVISIGIRQSYDQINKGQFFYGTSEFPGYNEPQSVHLTYRKDGDFQALYIDLRDAAMWAGDIGNCRLDPFYTCSGHCDYELYYIAFFKTMAGAVEFGKNWEEAKKNGTEMAPYATATAAPTKAPTQEPATQAPTDAPVTAAPATNSSDTDPQATAAPSADPGRDHRDGNGIGAGPVIGIAAGVIVIAAAAAIIIVRKRKGETAK